MTLIVNFFAGPSSGKSVSAAKLFYDLKIRGINAEYIQEYAKDKTWQEDYFTLKCQPYISAQQLYRQHRLIDKVDVAITDAPLLHGLVYPGMYTGDNFDKWLLDTFNSFNNFNIFIKRMADSYQQEGRNQSLEESIAIDDRIKFILHKHNVLYMEVDKDSVAEVADLIVDQLKSKNS